jgi:hypothetical protein
MRMVVTVAVTLLLGASAGAIGALFVYSHLGRTGTVGDRSPSAATARATPTRPITAEPTSAATSLVHVNPQALIPMLGDFPGQYVYGPRSTTPFADNHPNVIESFHGINGNALQGSVSVEIFPDVTTSEAYFRFITNGGAPAARRLTAAHEYGQETALIGIPGTTRYGATENVILHWRDRNVVASVSVVNYPSMDYVNDPAALLPLVEPAVYPIADLMESRIAAAS